MRGARGRLFDVRSLARSSAAYGAATLAITGLFATLITSANMLFQRFNVNANSPWFSVVFLFFAILAFNPLRERLQTLVDRIFDRDRASYRTALRDISEAMVSMLSLDEISNRMLTAVTQTLGVARAMLLIRRRGGQSLRPAAWRGGWRADPKEFRLRGAHPLAQSLEQQQRPLSRADFDSEAPELRDPCHAVFDGLNVRLLVPILFGGELLGAIAVGDKLSGESLGADDRQLLRTLSNNSAIAIKNAQAFAEIEQLNETLEARVAERNRELQDTQTQLMQSEKMRSLGQLVAGVAHERTTPSALCTPTCGSWKTMWRSWCRRRRTARTPPNPEPPLKSCWRAAARAPSASRTSCWTCAPFRAWTRPSFRTPT